MTTCRATTRGGRDCRQSTLFTNGYCKYHQAPTYHRDGVSDPTEHAAAAATENIAISVQDTGILKENVMLREHNICLNTQIVSEKRIISLLQDDLKIKDDLHQQTLLDVEAEHQRELQNIVDLHKQTLLDVEAEHQRELQNIEKEHQLRMNSMEEEHLQKISEIDEDRQRRLDAVKKRNHHQQQVLMENNTQLQMQYDALLWNRSPTFLSILMLLLTLILVVTGIYHINYDTLSELFSVVNNTISRYYMSKYERYMN